jgi:hypothetical protein
MTISEIEQAVASLPRVGGRPVGTLPEIAALTGVSLNTLGTWQKTDRLEKFLGSVYFADSVVSAAREAVAWGKWPREPRKPRNRRRRRMAGRSK